MNTLLRMHRQVAVAALLSRGWRPLGAKPIRHLTLPTSLTLSRTHPLALQPQFYFSQGKPMKFDAVFNRLYALRDEGEFEIEDLEA